MLPPSNVWLQHVQGVDLRLFAMGAFVLLDLYAGHIRL